MQTHVVSTGTAATKETLARRTSATQRVLIVNGTGDVLDVLERCSRREITTSCSSNRARTPTRKSSGVQPDLVILCLEMDDAEALAVLSMLKLDEETRDIPVVTYTTAGEEEQEDDEQDDFEPPMFAPRPALLMN
jgi:CheY-like chemotaxis protein